MKICNKLIASYGSEFLLWATPPNFKAKSLAIYLADWGKGFLNGQLYEFKKNIAPPVQMPVKTNLEPSEKVGEDAVIPYKPKTLKEFLNKI